MATITDVGKLRPELLSMSVSELERRKAEIDMAIAEKSKEEERKKRATILAEADKHKAAVVAGIKFLHDNGLLTEKLKETFSTKDGVFNPSLSIKIPKA